MRPWFLRTYAAMLFLPLLSRPAWTVPAFSSEVGGDDGRQPAVLRFGTVVAFAGRDLLVGRPATSARTYARNGGVHLFRPGVSGAWREVAVIAPRRSTPTDDFGAAIAVDGARMAVGAPGADSGRGAIYLFERDGNGRWLERAKLSSPTTVPSTATASGDRLGEVFALQGNRLVVGLPGHAKGTGRVLVFGRDPAGGWSERETIDAPDTARQYQFGKTVAAGDGRVFVGAPGAGAPGQVGFVAIYRESVGKCKEEARLTDADSTALGYGDGLLFDGRSLFVAGTSPRASLHEFRRSAAGSWDKAADGAIPIESNSSRVRLVRHGAELLVGMPAADSGAGAIVVMRYDSTGRQWTETQHLGVPTMGRQLGVGTAFAAAGTFLALGVPNMDGEEGSVALFRRDSATRQWRESATVADSAWSPTRDRLTGRSLPCENGHIRVFDCHNVELLSYLPLTAIGSSRLSDNRRSMFGWGDLLSVVWGWTDSSTGREFALVNRRSGMAFVEVTDPVNPKYLGTLPNPPGVGPALAHDVKVYRNHAFVVSESDGFGLQVFDLTQLRDVKTAPQIFQATAHYTGFSTAHTLAADPETGFVYAAGSTGQETCPGIRMIDVRTPAAPAYAGCYVDSTHGSGYVHETQCVVYHGPDARYRGHEICLNSSADALVIVDVTDKKAPTRIGTATYPNVGYVHQGWLTDDHRYFFLDDEGDENGSGMRTRTIVLDLNDLGDPVVAKEYFATTTTTDHNLYVRGRYVYESNYAAGLRILDAADPTNPKEVGFLDTTPDDWGYRVGSWTNYPFFKNDVVAVTSTAEGLFLVRLKPR